MADIRSLYTDKVQFYGSTSPRQLADEFGTPLFVYNENILRQRCRELKTLSRHDGFGVSYSVKANSNPQLLRIIREEGLAADAMSPGELAMDKLAGYQPSEIFYISNNNTGAELEMAADEGLLVSVDSLSQLETLGRLRPGIRVMARLNPGIGAGHHKKVVTGGSDSKFGIELDKIPEIISLLGRYELVLAGLNQHIGSLFMRPESYLEACAVLLGAARSLPREIFNKLEVLDFGGGFGIPYHKYEREVRLDLEALGGALSIMIGDWSAQTGYKGRFLVEPGRYVVAECGLVLGSVTSVKSTGKTTFVGTDIGFNVLMRPVLYDSFHDVEVYGPKRDDRLILQTIVGNICESGDILAKNRLLPRLAVDDLIAVLDAGAYGFSMASNYNMRLLPAEVLIKNDGSPKLIRRRQTVQDLEACLVSLD